MPRTPQLNDLQLILLSHAAKTDLGAIHPLPGTVADPARAEKELKALLRSGLVAEDETTNRAASWRSKDDVYFALTITKEGFAAIEIGDDPGAMHAGPAAQAPANTPAGAVVPPEPKPRSDSKIAGVIALLKRGEGATLAELVGATGWQPHTTRAALTGLRKNGHAIEKTKRGDVTCYKLADAG